MGLVVCIIDDDLVSQFATRYRIEQSDNDCNVISYDSVEKVLEMFMEDPLKDQKIPDILILDLTMPGMSGWEFLAEFENSYARENKIDIYVLSAFKNSKDRVRAKDHELIQGYFDKPLSKDNVDKIFHMRKV